MNIRGKPSNPCPVLEETASQLRPMGQKYVERGEDEHAQVQEREKGDTPSTVAAPDPTVRRMHIREFSATEGCPECKGIEAGRSMPHNNECRMRRRARCSKVKMVVRD